MGQKVNPVSFRLQVHKNWSSRWFGQNKRDFAAWLAEDIKIRELIEARYASRPTTGSRLSAAQTRLPSRFTLPRLVW